MGDRETVTGALGGIFNDRLVGTERNEHIVGGRGNDTLRAQGGEDRVEGGAGNDILYAGWDGPHTLLGGAGDDTLHGTGNTILAGGAGDDHLIGGNGGTMYGGIGRDAFDLHFIGNKPVHIRDFDADAGDMLILRNDSNFRDVTVADFDRNGDGHVTTAEMRATLAQLKVTGISDEELGKLEVSAVREGGVILDKSNGR